VIKLRVIDALYGALDPFEWHHVGGEESPPDLGQ
jgi:hypothetical protein